jgi:DNA invertase Pin-like site-specific DNA recombinase
MIRGYARVSTDGQSVNAPAAQLRAAGAEIVFRETGSGAKTDRAQLRRVLDQLAEGDVLMVTRLDQIREAVTRRANGEPVREIARSYAVHHSTISRLQGHG